MGVVIVEGGAIGFLVVGFGNGFCFIVVHVVVFSDYIIVKVQLLFIMLLAVIDKEIRRKHLVEYNN